MQGHCDKPGSIFLTASLAGAGWWLSGPPQPFLLQPEEAPVPQPLLTGQALQSPEHLGGPQLSSLLVFDVFLVLEAPGQDTESRSGLTSAEQRGIIASLDVLAVVLWSYSPGRCWPLVPGLQFRLCLPGPEVHSSRAAPSLCRCQGLLLPRGRTLRLSLQGSCWPLPPACLGPAGGSSALERSVTGPRRFGITCKVEEQVLPQIKMQTRTGALRHSLVASLQAEYGA